MKPVKWMQLSCLVCMNNKKENIQKDRICLIQGKKDRPTSIVVNRIEWIEV